MNLVSVGSEPSARVIHFSSGDEIKCRFEAELTTLVVEGEAAEGILNDPDIVLLPSNVLNDGKSLANKEFLKLIEPGNFDDEFGDGDSSSESEPSCETTTGAAWVASKIAAAESDCNEFERRLLSAIIRPGKFIVHSKEMI